MRYNLFRFYRPTIHNTTAERGLGSRRLGLLKLDHLDSGKMNIGWHRLNASQVNQSFTLYAFLSLRELPINQRYSGAHRLSLNFSSTTRLIFRTIYPYCRSAHFFKLFGMSVT
ncbi:hypothetical protein K443DRAFT_602988 [Laccaria amethystina LaAM-08-1]|uniref:Uncharacterized protein n=1 Tax=Laccaria amethystina LaAM-08-1 TaxID=1095629 RepID=A0A0C9X686_9AGAR|nr:hypothetical protein K443DRAFT_602988 [Laccaria amethystina LaAM-08-1]